LPIPENGETHGGPYGDQDADDHPASDTGDVDEYDYDGHYQPPPDQSYDLPRATIEEDDHEGAEEATEEVSDDQFPDPTVTEDVRDVLEIKVRAFQNNNTRSLLARTVETWQRTARESGESHRQQEARAAYIAAHTILSDGFEIWSKSAWEAKKFRRAARAHTLTLLHKSFTHWEECAREERERTAIARRHMLRIRYFSLWRSLHAETKKKVQIFRLTNLARLWMRAYMHHDIQHSVALRRYRGNLTKDVFEAWLDRYRAQFADDVRVARLKEHCIRRWHAKARQAVDTYEGIVVHERDQLMDDAFSTWQAVTEDLRGIASQQYHQKITHDLESIFDAWRTKAYLNRALREALERKDEELKSHAVDSWASKTAQATERAQLARRVVVQDIITHWRNEAKLKRWQSQHMVQLKLRTFLHWRMEQQLASFTQISEARSKERVLTKLRTAAAQSQTKALHGYRLADNHAVCTLQASVIEAWQSRTYSALVERDTATAVFFHNTASSCVDIWAGRAVEAAAGRVELEEFANRGAYYCLTSTTLTHWAKVADNTRRERLTGTYHAFRRKWKSKLAARCLSRWYSAARTTLSMRMEADAMSTTRLEDKLVECVAHWLGQARRNQAIHRVAKDAELEVWWGKWTAKATEIQETEHDAGEYYNEQTLTHCWNNWEFAALQYRSRQNTVAAFREKLDKTLCRQVMDMWLQKLAAPEGTIQDLRSSVTSRRSVRFGSVVRPGSIRATAVGASQPVPPTPRFDTTINESPIRSTPHKGTAFGRQSEQPHRQPAANPNPLSYSVPPRPPQANSNPDPPRYSRSLLNPSTQTHTPLPKPLLSDFDVSDISFAPSEAGDPDHPQTFMSTPTRWTGNARPITTAPTSAPRSGRGGALNRERERMTTTPSALLDTPHERALRREYDGAGGRGGVRFTPRVSFADIREESAEGDSRIFEGRI
jgi:protein SFI1